MKIAVLMTVLLYTSPTVASTLCFGPAEEKKGDVASDHRSWWQSFDYRVQVDDGPVIVPSSEESTPYEYESEAPLVKIWLGEKVVESFYVDKGLLAEGRNCIFFNNLYESWSIAELWQAEKLCKCSQ